MSKRNKRRGGEAEGVQHFAAFGVVKTLFLVGFEFAIEKAAPAHAAHELERA